jgi:transmembrane sensor
MVVRMKLTDEDLKKLDNYLEGEASVDAEYEFTEIFCDPEKEKEVEKFSRTRWYNSINEKTTDDFNLDRILFKIHYDINCAEGRPLRNSFFPEKIKWLYRIAAVIILPLLIYTAINFRSYNRKQNLTFTEVKAPAWTRVRFTLPDSTTGWLNSNSSLEYNGNFILDRKIILKGEAYFNVYHDTSRPFVVDAGALTVTALGTKFNVLSYNDEENMEVVLEEGRLLVKNKKMDKALIVNPDELITYDKLQDGFSTLIVQPKKYISWTDGKLVFRNDPIDVIARRLGRWYNVDVEVDGNNFDRMRLRATFIDENLEEVLYFLKRSLPIDYKIVNGGINPDETHSRKKVIITLR